MRPPTGAGRRPIGRLLVAAAILAGGCSVVSGPETAPAGLESDIADDGVRIEIVGDPETTSGQGDGQPTVDQDDRRPPTTQADGVQQPPPFTVVAQAVVPAMAARVAPSADAAVVAEFTNPTPTGAPLVFRSVDDSQGGSPGWLEVQLPIQPNGTTGWIRSDEVTLSDNPFRIEIARADYSLRVFERNQLWMETVIAVGNGATPTPVGDFYLLELLAPPNPDGPYGPFAFGLSGFSEVLEEFGGADAAIIGIHGTNDPASLGTDVSHGCVRLENEVIEELARTLPLGTPVRIT